MKKHRISKRIFAMLLVICMLFTMLPANVSAANAGDIVDNGMGLYEDSEGKEAGLSYSDSITWPIEIYDYANDGMLFDYASMTGNGESFALLDDKGEYVYMPDMNTTYWADYTKDAIKDSYVVKRWFPTWGTIGTQQKEDKTGLKYYSISTINQATELIDFRDIDGDGIIDSYNPTLDETSGNYTFANAYGHQFSISATATSETAKLINTSDDYNTELYKWWVKVELASENGKYKVVQTVKPGEEKNFNWNNGNIVMAVHSGGSHPGYSNWVSKVAAMALKPDDTLTLSEDGATVTVAASSDGNGSQNMVTVSNKDVQYAVIVYHTKGLDDTAATLEAMLRADDGLKYFGAYSDALDVSGDWAYEVLSFPKGYSIGYLNGTESSNLYNWETIDDQIQSAGIRLNESDSDSFTFNVSHFALFDTAEKAEAYGEKALVYNKHHVYLNKDIQYPDMSTGYDAVANYTNGEMINSKVLYYWFPEWGLEPSALDKDGNETKTYPYKQTYDDVYGTRYYNLHGMPGGGTELIDFSNRGNLDRSKAKYAVLVFNLSELDGYASVRAFVRGSGGDIDVSELKPAYEGQKWQYCIFDITKTSDANLDNEDNATSDKIQSAGIRIKAFEDEDGDGAYTESTNYNLKVSHFALFSTPEEADAYIAKAEDYHTNYVAKTAYYNPIVNNFGYGFLIGSNTNSTLYPNKFVNRLGYDPTTDNANTNNYENGEGIYFLHPDSAGDGTSVYGEDVGVTFDMSTLAFDGYQLLGTLTEGTLTAGLLEGTLGKDGNPQYREETIGYLANLLATTLVIPEYKNGYFNYDFVRGEKRIEYAINPGRSVDLATALRHCLGIDFDAGNTSVTVGNMDLTNAKVNHEDGNLLKGAWQECRDNIATCYDAAYYLLSNLFVSGSYNETPLHDYDYLRLHKTLTKDGKEAYIFDAGLTYKEDGEYKSALNYDVENKIIGFKTSEELKKILADGKAIYYPTAANPTTLFPFLPVTEDNTEDGMTKSPYFADDGVGYDGEYGATYYKRDYNYVMKSNGEFVYHEDDGLFFEFEGDDDVYLFIDGKLVLDIGGAHGITKQKINVNDYVQADILELEEGGIYSFDFFYMERHGFGANCRIFTNMRITDPALRVDKTAYQNNAEVNYAGVVDSGEKIEYNFKMENTGNTKLYNLTFEDANIGVTIDYMNGLTVTNNSNVFGKSGNEYSNLTAEDLTAVITGYKELTAAEKETNTEKTYSRDQATGKMYEDVNGDFIYTDFEVKFEADVDKNISANDKLKKFMATLESEKTESEEADAEVTNSGAGLWVNSVVIIKGIYYELTDLQKKEAKFSNTVVATATTKLKTSEIGYTKLQSQDEHRVYVPSDPYYYQWAGKEIIIIPTKLIMDMRAATNMADDSTDPFYPYFKDGLEAGKITRIEETTSTGTPLTTSTVTIDKNKNITVNYTDVGSHVFYLKVYYTGNSGASSALVPVVVNVVNVEDSYMVLDYGLTVDLTENDEIFKYDMITTPGRETDTHIMGIAGKNTAPSYDASADDTPGKHILTFDDTNNTIEGAYGDFKLTESEHTFTLTYKPGAFMEDLDTIYAAIAIHEHGEGFTPAELGAPIDISREVQMYKEISVLPANVVYYEDDFPAIKYHDENNQLFTSGNVFKQLDGTDDDVEGDKHEGSSNLTQSADQDQEYGQDDAYSKDSAMSGDSITEITINTPGKVAYFEFTGTGFEIVSRTNASKSATMVISVNDSNGNLVKYIPVVTEFDNAADGGTDEIYQVPVIRVKDLEHGKYTVSIQAVPIYDNGVWDPAKLYIDGLRIYQPLGATNEKYNSSENGAIFAEIRDLIVNGQAAVATYDESKFTLNVGTVTWTENRNETTQSGGEFKGNKVSSANDYLAFGPNNEVYMEAETSTGTTATSALVFYVEEQKGVEHNLQIAFRAIDKGLFAGGSSVETKAKLSYGVKDGEDFAWTEPIETNTATEQYVTIDYKNCPYNAETGYYQVVIKVESGMISYTSLKYNGLNIKNMDGESEGEIPSLIYVNGILTEKSSGEAVEAEIYPAFEDLELQFIAKDTVSFDELKGLGKELERIRYQTRNGKDVRLVGYVENLADYEKVSFILEINGQKSKELICTTAYAGLYAGGTLYTTEQIYEEEGYFVAFTINNYLKYYSGDEVKIIATYTKADGTSDKYEKTVTIN